MLTIIKNWYADWLLWRLLRVGQRLALVQECYETTDLNEYTEVWLGHLERRLNELTAEQRGIRERVNRLGLE